MKSFMKKFIVTICAISATLTLATATVSATDGFRSGPDSTAAVTDTTTNSTSADDKAVSATSNTSGASSVTSQATVPTVQTKKYLTKWGGFFWFVLSVVVNFILSCWVGNKFYNMSKRNTQSTAEIRALRKDIEEKFASSLREINEPALDVVNRNESYARNGEGIELPEVRTKVEINDEERKILGRWDMKRTSTSTADEENRGAKRAYAPMRNMSGIEFEESDERSEDTVDEGTKASSKINSIAKAGNKAGNKAKDFLSNIFPFDE